MFTISIYPRNSTPAPPLPPLPVALPQIQDRLSASTIAEDTESSKRLSHLLWGRFFAVCQTHASLYERQITSGGNSANGREDSRTQDGLPLRNIIFRHHAQLLAHTYFFQDAQVRRNLIAAHLGLVRTLSALVVAGEPSGEHPSLPTLHLRGLQVLLAQCMVLAEFMLRTFHDNERSLPLAARLRSDLARVPHVPAVAEATSNSSSRSLAKAGEKNFRYLCIYEADEEAGFVAWHERPGAARASSRALLLEVYTGGYEGCRKTWTSVLEAAATSSAEDEGYLFFSAWRLLGTVPLENSALGDGNSVETTVTGPSHLEPSLEGISHLRSCLLGLQTGEEEWGLMSPSFAAALSTVCERLPSWLGVEPQDLAEAMAPGGKAVRTMAQSEKMSRQLRIHGFLEAFSVYARAAISIAAKKENFGIPVPAVVEKSSPSSEGQDESLSPGVDVSSNGGSPLVEVSLGLMHLAEGCLQYYHRMIEAALTALHAIGEPEQLGDRPTQWARASFDSTEDDTSRRNNGASSAQSGEGGEKSAAVTPQIPSELAVPISLLVHCHTLSGSLARLSWLGCDHYLIGGLHMEVNYLHNVTVLEKLDLWHKQACTRSTSRGSQSSRKLSAPFAEPEGVVAEVGSRGGRVSHLSRKWEVMVTGAAWLTVASSQAFSGNRREETIEVNEDDAMESEDTGTDPKDTLSWGKNTEETVDYAAKLCISARSMLNAVLLSVSALTDALASAGIPTSSTRQGAAQSGGKSRGSDLEAVAAVAVGEAWSAIAFRAAALWGDASTKPWCKWFVPLCAHAFEKLVFKSDLKGVGSFSSEEQKREKARCALELWKAVKGAWQVRGANTLICLALNGSRLEPGVVNDRTALKLARVSAGAALEEGLEQLLGLLAMPYTASDVLGFYGGDRNDVKVNAQHGRAKVVEAIAAVVPRCTPPGTAGKAPTDGAAEGLESMDTESGTLPPYMDLIVPRGEARTLTSLLERQEFSGFLPKVLLVLRTALEAEANACTLPSSVVQSEGHPTFTSAVASALGSWPEGVLESLVAGAVLPRQSEVGSRARGTEDAIDVLSMVVGYPGIGRAAATDAQGRVEQHHHPLRKRFLLALLTTASSWAGRWGSSSYFWKNTSMSKRSAVSGVKGAAAEGALDLASLSLWLASKEGMFTELVVAVMEVARKFARMLEAPGCTADKMDVGKLVGQEDVGEEEITWLLARCLELIATVLRPAHKRVEEKGDTDSEGDDTALGFGEWGAGAGEMGWRSSTARAAALDTTAVASAGARQEPPLVCTFVSSQKEFVNQHWYHCYTCNLVNDKGCCRLCVRVCHRGHDVSYARLSCFFCDCGSSTADSAGEGDTPPPSLENSPASSSGGDGLSSSSPAVGDSGGASGAMESAQEGGRAKCDCLKARTRRELDALLHPSPAGAKATTSGDAALGPGSLRGQSQNGRSHGLRREGPAKKSYRSRPNQAAVSRAKLAAAAAEAAAVAAVEWRESPSQMSSMLTALFGVEGKTGVFENLRSAHSILLARFNALHEGGGVIRSTSSGFVGGLINGKVAGNGNGGASGTARAHPWDVLCDAMESAAATTPPPTQSTAFLRCRPLLDSNARAPAYPILAPARLVRNGSLDVRLPAEGAHARQDRAALALHGVVRRNLAASSCGKVAVAEAQKVLIVDPIGALALRYVAAMATGNGAGAAGSATELASVSAASCTVPGPRVASSSLPGPADTPVDRSHLCVVSTIAVGFDVIGVAFNPANERHLAAWGLRQCCVIVLNSRGVTLRRVQVRDGGGSVPLSSSS